MKKSQKLIVRSYKPTLREVEMTYDEFSKKYKDNLENAFCEWTIPNEESLPVSVLAETQEETEKNMFKYFLKNFVYNFNTYAYNQVVHDEKDTLKEAQGFVKVKCYNREDYSQTVKELEYVHVLLA